LGCIWEWKRQIFITQNVGLEAQFRDTSLPSVRERIQRSLDNEGHYPSAGSAEEYGFHAERVSVSYSSASAPFRTTTDFSSSAPSARITSLFHVHRAERADGLVGALGAVVRIPLDDPMHAEVVAVPTRGVERWRNGCRRCSALRRDAPSAS
jgi:hypothetical protein